MGIAVPQAEVKWIEFRSYSGPSITDGVAMPPPAAGHVGRAYWLTTKVETGAKYGAVMAYDGTCMTAGPDQHIAVYPKELIEEDWRAEDDQGSLWDLLAKLRKHRGSDPGFDACLDALLVELAKDGFTIGGGGHLCYAADHSVTVKGRPISVKTGDPVHGSIIRNTYTGPSDGKVPKTGPAWEKAKKWATLWHDLTVHPAGHAAQLDFGITHLVERTQRRQLAGLGTVESAVYGPSGIVHTTMEGLADLALCVYHAHSVNGPSPASTALAAALHATPIRSNPDAFARDLVRRLGNNSYGRWDDDVENGRYQRTRSNAKSSGFWPETFFVGPTAIMPKDLPG